MFDTSNGVAVVTLEGWVSLSHCIQKNCGFTHPAGAWNATVKSLCRSWTFAGFLLAGARMKLLFPFLLLAGVAFAQEAVPQHTLRILPLGDPPPFRQELRDGVRYEIPAAEGTVPPRQVLLFENAPEADKAEKPKEWPLTLRLGTVSPELKVPPPKDGAIMVKTQAGEPWLRIPLAQGSSTLALVWRTGKSWSEARAMCLPDDTKVGDFRFVNLTAKPMAVTWGEEKLKLNPAATMVRRLPDGKKALPLTIQYPAPEGGLRPCYSGQVENLPGTRQQFVIYVADGEKPKLPVKVLPLSEQL